MCDLVNLERKLNTIENVLSIASAVPVIGIIPGLAKVTLGIGQLGIATGATVIASICQKYTKDKKVREISSHVLEHSVDHIKHGAGNMLAGLTEGLPFIGTAVLIARIVRSFDSSKMGAFGTWVQYGDKFKFCPYHNLIVQDAYIVQNLQDKPTESNKMELQSILRELREDIYPTAACSKLKTELIELSDEELKKKGILPSRIYVDLDALRNLPIHDPHLRKRHVPLGAV
jgi:hypothetical protein